ncbi:MAG: hypothetical protein KKC11_06285 [Candidatus Omnitrophica bacterium]|nr:hypothetical protein [Candidatus Omnitrophota bacterium]MBU1811205.1 hypothetical protein [Candidatus Omnitrophota bacterium]
MENQQYLQEDEINLRDYINVIIKRKKLILAIFFMAVVFSTVVSFRMPKVYEITSTIELGNLDGILISKEEAKDIILNKNSLLSLIKRLNLDIEGDSLEKSIKTEKMDSPNLFKIAIKSSDVNTGFKIINAISANIITQGQSIYKERLLLKNERLEELNVEIKNAEDNIIRARNLISGISDSNNISQADISLRTILLQNTLPNYESNLIALRNQRNELKLSLVNAKDFKVFDAPIKPKNPIAPNKKRIVAIAGIISLMLGVFLAFFMEFWQKSGKT